MTPREELASFLATRGDCLTDNRRLAEAAEAYAWASALAPHDKRYDQILAHTHHRYLAQQEQEMALLREINQRNRERAQRTVPGPKAPHRPFPSGFSMPVPSTNQVPRLKLHEAMVRYSQQLMEWNRLNQMGRARGMPPSSPGSGTNFDY
jgi:hypothetical protein